jgi:hypothetical protein
MSTVMVCVRVVGAIFGKVIKRIILRIKEVLESEFQLTTHFWKLLFKICLMVGCQS